jgi:hypothetical protein
MNWKGRGQSRLCLIWTCLQSPSNLSQGKSSEVHTAVTMMIFRVHLFTGPSESLGTIYRTARRLIAEESNLLNQDSRDLLNASQERYRVSQLARLKQDH